jgi:hypothetical protein
MAEIRSLKLALLADTKDFIQGLDKADKETKTFSNKLDNALQKGAAAFLAVGAAAGAMAIKIGIDAVKAAVEDEKAQKSLAITLKNTTKATDAQIKSVEDYIDKTARATGIADDQLRPSLDRLVRSTQDVTKAQKLQQLALDIAAGTGKDLATVTEALGKAYDGNLGALKRIGVPLDENIIKTKDFDAATKALSETFAGQADAAAETFAGRMARIKIAIDEAKEQLGQALLPLLERFARFATEQLAPALQGLVDGLTAKGKQSLTRAFYDAGTGAVTFGYDMDNVQGQAYLLGEQLRRTTQLLVDMLDKVTGAAEGEGFKKLLTVITSVISGLEKAIELYNSLPDFGKLLINPIGQLAPLAGAAAQIPSTVRGGGTTVNNYNIKGAVDPQGTARTITKVQNTALKTTGIKPFNFGFR